MQYSIARFLGNRYRSCIKFRIKIGISDANAQVDWRDNQIKMPTHSDVLDYLIKSFAITLADALACLTVIS